MHKTFGDKTGIQASSGGACPPPRCPSLDSSPELPTLPRTPTNHRRQCGPVDELSKDQRSNLDITDITSSHPAYFLLRRKCPGTNYVDKPVFRTRSELLAQRKEALKPDVSFDLDGAGVVGVREMFFAAQMDHDVSGHLSNEEKLLGLKHMKENSGNYMFIDVSPAPHPNHNPDDLLSESARGD